MEEEVETKPMVINLHIERLIDKVEIVAGQEGFDTVLAEKVTAALSKLCMSLQVDIGEKIVQNTMIKIFSEANQMANLR